jgi:glucosamine-6-phosphate deaminase
VPVVADVFPDPQRLGEAAAELVADGIVDSRGSGKPFLLGCPGGRSAQSTYQALAGLVTARHLDLGHVVVVMMDDYLVPGPDGALRHEDVEAPHSCIRFGVEQIVRPLSAAAGPGRGIADVHLWVPDPVEPEAYDTRIADAGGIDVFLLASGAGDGHVAFNSPGAAAESRTRVVELPETTRRDNLATFPSFGDRLDRVPRHGVTVGVATIADQSHAVLMLVHGADKGLAAQHLMAAREYDPGWPATVFAACRRPRLLLDQAAVTASRAPVS